MTIMRSLSPADHELGAQRPTYQHHGDHAGPNFKSARVFGSHLSRPAILYCATTPLQAPSTGQCFAGRCCSCGRSPVSACRSMASRMRSMDSNQIHILFAPLMSAYGLAMISILWARLGIAQRIDSLRHAHLIMIVAISAGPMLLSIPQDVRLGLRAEGLAVFLIGPPTIPKQSTIPLQITRRRRMSSSPMCHGPWHGMLIACVSGYLRTSIRLKK